MRRSWTPALSLAVLVLVLADWVSKYWIIGRLGIGESVTLLEGWLYFVHRKNTGVAFSMLADLPDTFRVPLLAGVSIIGVVLFAWLVITSTDRLTRLAAALVVAGAIGNLGDRLLNGHVTDFVLVSFFPFVFNLADAAITVGGVLLATRLALVDESEAETAAAEAA